ncbi:MAG: hypothetical protein KF765_12180 [Parvibaculaceae bacterium]|nr:hypothetical protein [Parvibaculaceae bacterium]
MIGVHLHAPFEALALDTFEFGAGESVAAVAARQNYVLPFFALLNGEPVLRKDWDRALEEGDELGFCTLPAGGGAKDIFRTVLQIAIVAVAIYFAGPAGLNLSGAAMWGARAAAIIGSGYLVNALMPPQTPSAHTAFSNEAASPTYSLTPQGNQARLGQKEPEYYGYMRIVPDFAAQPYVEYRDNDLYLHQLFCLGLGRSDIHEIGIEKTPLWTELEGFTGRFSDVEIEIVEPGEPVTLIAGNVITSVEVSGQTLLGTNEDGAGWIGPFAVCPPGRKVNRIANDIVWPNGAFRVSDTGALQSVTAGVLYEAREIDDFGAPQGDWFELTSGDYVFAKREQQRVTAFQDVPEARYEVRGMRTNEKIDEDRVQDEVQWAGLKGYVPNDNVFSRVTVLAVVMRATNQLSNVTSRRFYTIQTRRLPVYDTETGTWSVPVATRSIAAAAANIIRNPVTGWGLPDNRVDWETLWQIDEETWSPRGERFDGAFDSRTDVWRALIDVLHVGRAYPVRVGSSVSFVRDEPREAARLMLTPRNIVRGSFAVDFAHFTPDTPDYVIVRYFDERVWEWRTVHCKLPGSTEANPATITVRGINDRTNAWRYGMFRVKVNRYRRMFPRATTELEGRFVKRGDLIPVSHPLITLGRSGDVAGFDPETRQLTLTVPAGLEEEGDYYLVLKRPDGRAWGPVLVAAGAGAYELVADEEDLAGAIAAHGDWADFVTTIEGDREATAAVWGKAGEFVQDCLLIGARPEGGDRMVLELQADDPRVYDESEDGEPPEEEDLDILPVAPEAPPVTGLQVTVGGSRFAPEIVTSIDRSPGAQSYLLQLSYDHQSWRTLSVGDVISWTGFVEPTTVWLRWTAIGTLRGEPVEWYADLTATEQVPAQVTISGVQIFFKSAWINLAYPAEDGIEGVIAKVSTETGFDPEAAGEVVYDGTPISRMPIAIPADATVYVRAAAWNRFGKVNLNWSDQVSITAAKVEGANLSEALAAEIAKIEVLETAITEEQNVRFDADEALAESISSVSAVVDGNSAAIVNEALARADADEALASTISAVQATVGDHTTAIEETMEAVAGQGARVTLKTDVDGYVVGTELINGGEGSSFFTLLVDVFQVVKPGINGGEPFPLFTVTEAGVRLNSLVAPEITAEVIWAALIAVGRLEALILSSPLEEEETLDDAAMVVDTQSPYILMRKPAP